MKMKNIKKMVIIIVEEEEEEEETEETDVEIVMTVERVMIEEIKIKENKRSKRNNLEENQMFKMLKCFHHYEEDILIL